MDSLYRTIIREGSPLFERMQLARDLHLECGEFESAEMEAWTRAVAPQHPVDFEKRLAWSGLTPAQAAWALSPDEKLPLDEPAWLPLLKELQGACRNAAWDKNTAENYEIPFAELLEAIVEFARHHLASQLDEEVACFVTQTAMRSFSLDLLRELSELMTPVLYSLFCDARGAGPTLLASLREEGSDPSERTIYLPFVRDHLEDGLSTLLHQYPVLGRLLAITVQRWIDNCGLIIRRIFGDAEGISRYFRVEGDAILQDVTLGLSDPHHHGQSVVALALGVAPDRARTVIYKPRSLQVEEAFQNFLHAINSLSEKPFRTLTVLPMQDYGYIEFVERRLQTDAALLPLFYEKAGRLLAVLYLSGCNDCHNENLIACDGELVLIDAETLLQAPRAERAGQRLPRGSLDIMLTRSVLAVGMLPQWRFVASEGRISALDSSALAPSRPAGSTYKDNGWTEVNTDAMRRTLVNKAWETPSSSPVEDVDDLLLRYRDRLETGFRQQMEIFVQHRGMLLTPTGPLAAFEGLRQRVVVRPTQIYSTLAVHASQPEALVSSSARGLVLDQLSRKYLTGDAQPFDWNVLEDEIRQLEALDIPYFQQSVDGDALWLSTGEKIRGFAEISGLRACYAKLEALNLAGIDLQVELIRGSIDARFVDSTAGDRVSPVDVPARVESSARGKPDLEDESSALLEGLRIAAEIQKRAMRGDDGSLSWLGLELGRDGERFSFGPVGPWLYSGSSGIAVFLASAAQKLAISNPEAAAGLRSDALGAIENLLTVLRSSDSLRLHRMVRDASLGLSGIGGAVLALLLLHQLQCTEPPETFAGCAVQLAQAVSAERIASATHVDVISGTAGLIGPMLSLASLCATQAESRRLRHIAMLCGERILACQQEDGGWAHPSAKRGLTGFAHGASGIVAALARLHRETGMPGLLDAARRGLEYERLQYSASAANWPDYRKTSEPIFFMNSWCHGAAGVGLSRLCLKGSDLWDGLLEEELVTALESTMNFGFRGTDHLCCGNLGRAAILDLASDGDAASRYAKRAAEIVSQTVDRAAANGGLYRFDPRMRVDTYLPGLFNGYAGVGLKLLCKNNEASIGKCLTAGLI